MSKKQGIAIGIPLMMSALLVGQVSRSPVWATMRVVDMLSLFAAGMSLFAAGMAVGVVVRGLGGAKKGNQ